MAELKKVDFFIVGAARCGTTSLYGMLDQHPHVCMSPVKEPNFFSSDVTSGPLRRKLSDELQAESWQQFIKGDMNGRLHNGYIRNIDDYHSLFRKCKAGQMTGEASVSYLYSAEAAEKIAAYNPKAKIIIILRQPAERAFSHYQMERRLTLTDSPFLNDLYSDIGYVRKDWGSTPLYIELGRYYSQVKRYYDVFGPAAVKTLLYDDFISSANEVFADVCTFLGIPEFKAQAVHSNGALLPRKGSAALASNQKLKVRLKKPLETLGLKTHVKKLIYTVSGERLDETEKRQLTSFFYNDIHMLSRLLQKDLSHWL
jgi:hypothetical protein